MGRVILRTVIPNKANWGCYVTQKGVFIIWEIFKSLTMIESTCKSITSARTLSVSILVFSFHINKILWQCWRQVYTLDKWQVLCRAT